MDEGRGRHQGLSGLGCGFDEVTQDGIVSDLQRYAAIDYELCLQSQDDPATVIPERSRSIQFGANSSGNVAAVAGLERQVRSQPGQ